MIYLSLLIVEMLVLYSLSRSVSKALSKFMSIGFLSVLFLPGIVLHELAHMFAAVILFVPVGQMEFIPKRNGNSVKLGSVEVGKTDPIRRGLIGFAPVLLGMVVVVGAIYLFGLNISFLQGLNPAIFVAVVLAFGYLLFAVGNTMFSSPRDLEGTAEVLIALLVIFVAGYLLGFRLPLAYLNKIITKEFVAVIQKSINFLLLPIAIDLLILGAIRALPGSRNQRS